VPCLGLHGGRWYFAAVQLLCPLHCLHCLPAPQLLNASARRVLTPHKRPWRTDKGFGVGHTRATQTKGVWLWAAPQEAAAPGGGRLSVVYVDTEGFESTGKCVAHNMPACPEVYMVHALMHRMRVSAQSLVPRTWLLRFVGAVGQS